MRKLTIQDSISGVLFALSLLAAVPLAASDSPWYVIAKVGQASVSKDFGPGLLGWRVDDEDDTAGVEVGYRFHPNLAFEAGYRDLGTYPGQPRPCPPGQLCPLTLTPAALIVPVFPMEAEFTAYSLTAVPRWPINERASVFGKLGVLDWDSDLDRFFAGNPPEDPSGTDFLAGIGAEYVFPSGLGLLLEYESSDLASAFHAGASWHF